ncbi:MAG: hypothetical protein GC162_01230 [Planctomycetes bacterium]|nr:hypothetical protein [Planctomycetota bacterium]
MMSRRERIIAIVAATAVLLLGLDRFVLSPLQQWRDELSQQTSHVVDELESNNRMIRTRRELSPRWRDLVAAHLPTDPAAAESQLLYALRDAAKNARLNVTTLQPERPAGKEELREVVVSAVGVGSMDAIAHFLYQLDNASMAVRVRRMRIGASEGKDDLTIELRVSTLYRVPVQNAAAAATRPATGGAS